MAQSNTIVYGINPVLEFLRAAPGAVKEVWISGATTRRVMQSIGAEALSAGLVVKTVSPQVLDELTGAQKHQGVIAKIEPYSYLSLEQVLKEVVNAPGEEMVVILDGLTDPRNFGALLRTAEAVGVRHVLIPKDRAVDVTPATWKASAGAASYLKIAKVINLRRAIISLKEIGFWIVGLDVRSRSTIYERSYPEKLAIVLGSEGRGIRPVILKECDFTVSIPMLGRIASLNVSAAGAVVFYEVLRQRRIMPMARAAT